MPLTYDNSVSPWYSVTYRDFSPAEDWTVNEITDLSLWIQGQAEGNTPANLYVVVEDGDGNSAKVRHPHASVVTTPTWSRWVIPLDHLTGVNLTRIERLSISVGDPDSATADGTGTIFVDDIWVMRHAAPEEPAVE